MFTNIKRNLLTLTTLVFLLVPSFLYAGTFSSDPAIEVFPTNEILEFQANTNQKVTETFSIKNTSDRDKTILVRSYPKNGFEYFGTSYLTVQANSSTYISVQFNSSKAGLYQSEIKLQHNDTLETKTIKLQAEVFEASSNNGVTISKSKVDFGDKPTGSTTTSTLQINNNNNFDINIGTKSLDTPFRIISAPKSIPANQSETITIEFKPTKTGNFKQNFNISTSDTRNSNFNINILGNSKTKNNQDKEGNLNLSTSNLNFYNVDTGVSISKSITITNPNNFDVEVKAPNDTKAPFRVSLQNSVNNRTTLRANSSKKVNVTFEPKKEQFYEEEVVLSTNLSNNPNYSIKVQANANFRNNNSNQNNSNTNNPIPFQPNSYSPTTSVKTTRSTLNPDLAEISYFQVNFGREFEKNRNTAILQIKDTKLDRIIHSQTIGNLNQGLNNWKLQWDGKNSEENSVLEGDYSYNVSLVSPSGFTRNFNGNIEVVRNVSHIPQTIVQTPSTLKHCLTYTDVHYDTNLCDSVVFANSQNLLKEGETRLYPNQKVTRAQALSSLVKLFDLEMETYNKANDGNLGFSDLDKNDWIMPFIKTIQAYDTDQMILNGYSNLDSNQAQFKPEQPINRAEFYKWMFEIANLETQESNNYLMDYYITKKPFKDTRINSDYDWFTPYAELAKNNFNHSNFSKKYFNTFSITEYSIFCPEHEINKKEFFETIYEVHKTNTVSFN